MINGNASDKSIPAILLYTDTSAGNSPDSDSDSDSDSDYDFDSDSNPDSASPTNSPTVGPTTGARSTGCAAPALQLYALDMLGAGSGEALTDKQEAVMVAVSSEHVT
eukprot:gene13198-15592_t